jgi:hypothetical protein
MTPMLIENSGVETLNHLRKLLLPPDIIPSLLKYKMYKIHLVGNSLQYFNKKSEKQ